MNNQSDFVTKEVVNSFKNSNKPKVLFQVKCWITKYEFEYRYVAKISTS